MQTDGNEKEQLIRDLRERLNWYTFEAPEEEFDEKEVEALAKLLTVLEAGKDGAEAEAAADFAQFQKYLAEKRKDATQLASLHDSDTGRRCVRISKGRYGFAATAAAAVILLVVLSVAGSTMGSTNAAKNGGFFYWLHRDEKGEKLVLSPQGEDSQEKIENPQKFYTEEDFLEQYPDYGVGFGNLDTLQGYELERIELSELKYYSQVIYKMIQEEKEVCIGMCIYEDNIAIGDRIFKDYSYIEEKKVQGFLLYIYRKKDVDGNIGNTDYAVCFYLGERQYFVCGELPVSEIEAIAAEYAQQIIIQE